MENQRIYNLRNDKEIEEVRPRVFLQKHVRRVNPDEILTIKEIMEAWGYGQFYDEMIDHFVRLIKNNTDEDILAHYDTGGLEKKMSSQKLLGWSIFDEKIKKFGLVGGVLFQEGEMSFHT